MRINGPDAVQINNSTVPGGCVCMKDPRIESEEAQDETEDIDIDGTEDYGFVFGSDGELKHMFTPDGFYLEPPPVVKKILKLLGIKDINALPGPDILH
jgi:hypothetical protein